MKTSFIHGLGMAIAGFVLALVMFFLGFHDSPDKLGVAQTVGLVGGLAITLGGLILAIRARRAETPADEPFGYGRALGTGTLTGLFSSAFGAISTVLYATVINPGFQEVVIETQIAKMEEQGMGAAQIEQAEGMIRMMSGPAAQGVFGFIGGFVFSFIFALIIAAFLKRPAADPTPPPIAS